MDILNLPGLKELSVDETDDALNIQVVTTFSQDYCPTCGCVREHNLVKYGTKVQRFMDIPQRGKRVGIYVHRQRWLCRSCETTCWEDLPDMHDTHFVTERLYKFVCEQALKKTFTSVADDVGLDEKTIRIIFDEYAAELDKQYQPEIPKWIGIDEIYFGKKAQCVVTDIERHALIELLVDRDKNTIKNWFSRFDLSHVEYVTMDMYRPYKTICRELMPQAKVVVDKFHLLRYANYAVGEVRKQCQATLSNKERASLKGARRVFDKHLENIEPKDKLTLWRWTDRFPILSDAYQLKEFFYDIYDCTTKEDALAQFAAWKELIPPELKPFFNNLVRMIRNWQPEILNYYEKRLTNAYTEGFNRLIRIANAIGGGYTFPILRAKMLFSDNTRRQKYARIKYDKHGEPLLIRQAIKMGMDYLEPLPISQGPSFSVATKHLIHFNRKGINLRRQHQELISTHFSD